jgi:putative SOS response-associated peptidase YedK
VCGRFALNTTEAELRAHFSLKNSFVFKSKYNIAPTQIIPVVVLDKVGLPELVFMRWGFIPSWQKTPESTGYINARIETISEKPTFKQAFEQKRCLIPASGFYEWQLIHQRKQPFFVFLKNQPLLALAGIWALPTASDLFPTCAILTKSADAESKMGELHERMPVIVPGSDYLSWLNTHRKSEIQVSSLLPTERNIGYFPVSLQVNSPQFDHPDCLRPLS